jgi:hypothetical protein
VTRILKGKGSGRRSDAANPYVVAILLLLTEAENGKGVPAVLEPAKFSGEMLDVDARAPVHVRGIFVGKEQYLHGYTFLTRSGSECLKRYRSRPVPRALSPYQSPTLSEERLDCKTS